MLKVTFLQSLFDEIQRQPAKSTFEFKENDTIKNLLKKAQEIHGSDDFKSFFECAAKEILYKIAVGAIGFMFYL